jgi:transcription termination/antitermination protein NusG
MKKWYVVHTYASQEFRIKEVIEKGLKGTELEDKIGQVLVPTQRSFLIREGKKVERERKIFNSYIIVEADLTPQVMEYIRNIPGVTNFLGARKQAVPLSEAEVNRLLGISDREAENAKSYEFLPGDSVKIVAGPFTEFVGIVRKVSAESTKLTVDVTVFGRVTPVEVTTDQLEISK